MASGEEQAETPFTGISAPVPDMSVFKTVNTRNKKLAVAFAEEAIDEAAVHLGPRIVFFCDGGTDPRRPILGSGITYRELPSHSRGWVDFAFALLGSNDSGLAELVGVNCALSIALEEKKRRRGEAREFPKVLVFTDSMNVITWTEHLLDARPSACNRLDNPAFKDLSRHLSRLASRKILVEFHWVKGHAGASGNRRADRLARLAVRWSVTRARRPRADQGYEITLTPHTLPETWSVEVPVPKKRKRREMEEEDKGLQGQHGEEQEEGKSPDTKRAKTE
ncbi:hypothetical protein DL769_005079 [Monosporascus sp. CRB-8-3]|nr:hypothetical protein DL769_005079 [Monosporascus sp. CRB-8-3]